MITASINLLTQVFIMSTSHIFEEHTYYQHHPFHTSYHKPYKSRLFYSIQPGLFSAPFLISFQVLLRFLLRFRVPSSFLVPPFTLFLTFFFHFHVSIPIVIHLQPQQFYYQFLSNLHRCRKKNNPYKGSA